MAGTYADAWNQASEQTGLNEVSPEMGYGVGIAIAVAEIAWWVFMGWLSRKGYKLLRRKTRKNAPKMGDGRGNQSWPPQQA